MSNLISPLVRQTLQRWSEKTSTEATVEETFELDGSELTGAVTRAASQPGKGSTGSVWDDMFEKGFGKLKQEPKPEKGVTEPLPEPEADVVSPEPTPVLVEIVEPAPEPTPVTEDSSTPVLAPEPETNTSEPAPPLEETATPATGETGPSDITRAIAPTTLDNSGTINVAGGRVTTFALPDDANVTNVVINALPAYGNVTVNPDLTLALVLSGSAYSGPLSFDYTVTHNDGTTTTHTATLDVAAPTQAAGWGLGNHYMLETDANGNLVIEHGDNHHKIYTTNGEHGLARADIAALEGISEAQITGQWLLENSQYGGSEALPLSLDMAKLVHSAVGNDASQWIYLERGYEYDVAFFGRNSIGESELHPRLITSWGTGDRPIITVEAKVFNEPAQNIVLQDVAFAGGVSILTAQNIIFDGILAYNQVIGAQSSSTSPLTGLTIRNSEIIDSYEAAPNNPEYWAAFADRGTGIFVSGGEGILLEGNLIHHNGWAEGYDQTVENGQPPSMYSHNVYIQNTNTDVTFRDNITAQGSSYGAMLRPGAFAEGNLFLDNNAAVEFLGGDYQGAGPIGNFTLFLDNVITSAGYKIADKIGATNWGIRNEGRDSTLLDNIIAHMADPNNPDEIAAKPFNNTDPAYNLRDPFYEDTIIYNWNGHEANLEGLDPTTLNQITIQNFALEFLGIDPANAPENEDMGLYYKSGLIYALMDYARLHWQDGSLTTRAIIDWFQSGFGFTAQLTDATYHRFVPNDLGDGVRWDNRLNWTSDELPTNGDIVDLGGNWVNFGGTVSLDKLDLGSGGKLQVGSGKLSVDTLETGENGGMVFVERAGQLWTNGYSGETPLSLQITGGRFANTGEVNGPVIMSVQGGQSLLGIDDASFVVGMGSELRIYGSTAKVGFDGSENGVATLKMQDDGQLSFIADAQGISRLTEFRSGAWDQEGSNVHSGVALNGTLALDLSEYIGTGSMKLIEVDAIVGMLDNVDIHGLGTNRDAALVIDYAADIVIIELSNGTGQSSISIRGDAAYGDDEDAALWDALTSGLEPVVELDAPITVFDSVIEPLAEMSFI